MWRCNNTSDQWALYILNKERAMSGKKRQACQHCVQMRVYHWMARASKLKEIIAVTTSREIVCLAWYSEHGYLLLLQIHSDIENARLYKCWPGFLFFLRELTYLIAKTLNLLVFLAKQLLLYVEMMFLPNFLETHESIMGHQNSSINSCIVYYHVQSWIVRSRINSAWLRCYPSDR
jgi:hypothetical protein